MSYTPWSLNLSCFGPEEDELFPVEVLVFNRRSVHIVGLIKFNEPDYNFRGVIIDKRGGLYTSVFLYSPEWEGSFLRTPFWGEYLLAEELPRPYKVAAFQGHWNVAIGFTYFRIDFSSNQRRCSKLEISDFQLIEKTMRDFISQANKLLGEKQCTTRTDQIPTPTSTETTAGG